MRPLKRKMIMKKKRKKFIVLSCIILAAVIVAVSLIYIRQKEEKSSNNDKRWSLGDGIYIVSTDSYSGPYMEDGSDEKVQNIWQIEVVNESSEDIQYMEISASCGEKTAKFQLTTLLAGSTVKVLESTRMEYPDQEKDWNYKVETTAKFTQEPSMHSDILNVYAKDNWIKIENKSDQDLTQDIYVYYKNMDGDAFDGGITYRIRFEGGLAPGESAEKQVTHYESEKSQIVYLTCQ